MNYQIDRDKRFIALHVDAIQKSIPNWMESIDKFDVSTLTFETSFLKDEIQKVFERIVEELSGQNLSKYAVIPDGLDEVSYNICLSKKNYVASIPLPHAFQPIIQGKIIEIIQAARQKYLSSANPSFVREMFEPSYTMSNLISVVDDPFDDFHKIVLVDFSEYKYPIPTKQFKTMISIAHTVATTVSNDLRMPIIVTFKNIPTDNNPYIASKVYNCIYDRFDIDSDIKWYII